MTNVYGQTLLDDMVSHQGLPMSLVKQAAKEILLVIRQGLIQDGSVSVTNFGTFRLKAVAARKGFNPKTREPMIIPAQRRVIFTPCKALRELIQPVHQAPIPIPPETKAPRAAAKVAAIATTPTVTKHIPLEEAQGAVKESPPPVATAPETTPAAEAKPVDPDVQAVQAEKVAEPPVEVTSKAIKDASETVPTEPAREADTEVQPESAPESKPASIDLELSEGPDEDAEETASNKGIYLGAAAVIVLAVVGAYLLSDTGTAPKHFQATPPVTPDVAISVPVQVQTIPEADSITMLPPEVVSEAADVETPGIPAAETTPEPEPIRDPVAKVVEPEPTPAAQRVTEEAIVEQVIEPLETVVSTETAPIEPAPAQETAVDPLVTAEVTDKPLATENIAPAAAEPTVDFFFSETVHNIARGESLWRLAKKHYQDPLLWPHIYQANAAIISNPDQLRQGQTIVLPSLQGTPDNLTKTDRRNIAEGYYLTYLHYKKVEHKDAFFALLEAKRYDMQVVEEHRGVLRLSKLEEIMLSQQETMPF